MNMADSVRGEAVRPQHMSDRLFSGLKGTRWLDTLWLYLTSSLAVLLLLITFSLLRGPMAADAVASQLSVAVAVNIIYVLVLHRLRAGTLSIVDPLLRTAVQYVILVNSLSGIGITAGYLTYENWMPRIVGVQFTGAVGPLAFSCIAAAVVILLSVTGTVLGLHVAWSRQAHNTGSATGVGVLDTDVQVKNARLFSHHLVTSPSISLEQSLLEVLQILKAYSDPHHTWPNRMIRIAMADAQPYPNALSKMLESVMSVESPDLRVVLQSDSLSGGSRVPDRQLVDVLRLLASLNVPRERVRIYQGRSKVFAVDIAEYVVVLYPDIMSYDDLQFIGSNVNDCDARRSFDEKWGLGLRVASSWVPNW